MELNEFTPSDHIQDMRDKVTFAFEESPVFDRYLQTIAMETMELQEVYKQLMQERSIETAIGKQLDILGNIVGQSRQLVNTGTIPFFGFQGATGANSYGDINDRRLGGYFWDINQPRSGSTYLTDEQYRLFIKAKIIKNVTRATPEDVIKFVQFVFGARRVQVSVDEGAEQAVVLVSDDLNDFEMALLAYFVDDLYRSYFVPKTLGVGIVFGVIPVTEYFAYAGTPDAYGYGTLNPTTGVITGGGRYSTLI